MIDEIRLIYAALGQATTTRSDQLRFHALDQTDSRINLALDDAGHEHLLVESPDSDELVSDLAMIKMTHRELNLAAASRRYLDVTCENKELTEVFEHFIAAVAESTSMQEDPGSVVARVLDRWRSFFTEAGPPPGREKLTGILGELLVLRDIAAVQPDGVITAWVGPRGGRHDFRRAGIALEVKTSRSHTSHIVTIHGEDQLLEPDGATLHLHFVRLEEVAGLGSSIGDLIDELSSHGVPRVELIQVLSEAGVPPASLSEVAAVRFQIRERLTVPVDAQTPRIIPSSFASGARPAGVVDVTYRIDLDHVLDRALSPEAYGELIAGLASGPSAL